MHPLGYFSPPSADAATFARISETCGDYLDKLDREELLTLIVQVIAVQDSYKILPPELIEMCQQLSPEGALALMQAVISQLRYGSPTLLSIAREQTDQ